MAWSDDITEAFAAAISAAKKYTDEETEQMRTKFVKVNALPAQGDSQTIYLVPKTEDMFDKKFKDFFGKYCDKTASKPSIMSYWGQNPTSNCLFAQQGNDKYVLISSTISVTDTSVSSSDGNWYMQWSDVSGSDPAAIAFGQAYTGGFSIYNQYGVDYKAYTYDQLIDPYNTYDEYIWTSQNTYEKIGDTEIDLSDYATKEEFQALLNKFNNQIGDHTVKTNVPKFNASFKNNTYSVVLPTETQAYSDLADGEIGFRRDECPIPNDLMPSSSDPAVVSKTKVKGWDTIASANTLGKVKVGTGLSINPSTGALSLDQNAIGPEVAEYCSEHFSEWSGALDDTLESNVMAAPANKVGELKSALSDELTLHIENDSNILTVQNGQNMTHKHRERYSYGRMMNTGEVSPSTTICYSHEVFSPAFTGTDRIIKFDNARVSIEVVLFNNGTNVMQSGWKTSDFTIGANKTYTDLYINVKKIDGTTLDLIDAYTCVYYEETINSKSSEDLTSLKENNLLYEELDIYSDITKISSRVKLPVISGQDYNVYYDNLTDGMDNSFCGIGCNSPMEIGYNKKASWTEGSLNFDTIVLRAWINTQKRTYMNKYVYLNKVAYVPTGSIKCLLIGDSMTEYGSFQKTANDILADGGLNVTWVGTKQTSGLNNEGRSGWNTYYYCTKSENNPFYNPSTQKFDFSYYMAEQGYDNLDCVLICLGTNDFFGSPAETDEQVNTAWETVVNSIRVYDANIKIAIWLAPPTCLYNGVGQVGNFIYGHYKSRKIVCNKFAGSSYGQNNTYVIPTNLVVDPMTDFEIDSTTDRCIDTTHPIASGYAKLGKVIAAMLAYLATQ